MYVYVIYEISTKKVVEYFHKEKVCTAVYEYCFDSNLYSCRKINLDKILGQ